jgi:putative copper export protein
MICRMVVQVCACGHRAASEQKWWKEGMHALHACSEVCATYLF